MHTLLIIINGLPAVGKTTLARKLAKDLSLPLLCKDDIKEALFDSLGIADREWALKLGLASMETLFRLTEIQLQAKVPGIVVESAYWPEQHNARWTDLIEHYRADVMQVWCTAPLEVTLLRENERTTNGTRHAGHAVPSADFEQYKTAIETRGYGRLDIPGSCFDMDLTDFNQADYLRLRKKLSLMMVG